MLHLKWRVLVNSKRYFFVCAARKNAEFSTCTGDLVDVEDVYSGSSEYAVRVLGLVCLLLHCNANNLVLEILKHDKVWGRGQFALTSPTINYGRFVPVP